MEGLSRLLDVHNMPFYLINFLLLVVAVRLFVYKPVVRFMQERQRREQDAREAFERNREELKLEQESISEERRRILAETETEVDRRLTNADSDAKALISNAESQAERILEFARIAAKAETAKAREELREEISRLSVQLASKILDREVRAEDHSQLVGDFLDKL